MCDRILQHRTRGALLLEIALQRLERVLADQQLAEVLEIGQALEKQDPLDEAIGVLHLVDRLLLLVVLELLQAPVAEHAGVQEVLVDRGELVEQHLVQMLYDLRITFHRGLLKEMRFDDERLQASRKPRGTKRRRRLGGNGQRFGRLHVAQHLVRAVAAATATRADTQL